ncbi:phosphoribosylamine--glycine ligase [Candidatus Bipolaricaulota bacterium]|nr:phosphoribosylamine--glycine ligase [Candidatus Bipolaricaulota bacterium]
MKVLVVGHGAREHAIAAALYRSPSRPRLFAYMATPNPGIRALVEDWKKGDLDDVGSLLDYVARIRPELVVFGPETPLAAGAVDALEERGVPCVGPKKALAQIEVNKSFMRGFMARNLGRGFPRWWVLRDLPAVERLLRECPDVVLKPLGLTGGKGVRVMGKQLSDIDQALQYARGCLERDGAILIEERLEGEEFSLMAFTDGRKVLPMPLVQDYKYAYEGDRGPMTGGMGSYSCADHLLPFLREGDAEAAFEIVKETVVNLGKEAGTPYRGILYGQFMQTQDGPKIIEFNARFGDPEAMNVLSLLRTDPVEVFLSIAAGDLVDGVRFAEEATVCRYLVPEGYPERPRVGLRFSLPVEELSGLGVEVYFGSVSEAEGMYVTTGSRSVALLAKGESPKTARALLDGVLERYSPPGLYFRHDIPKLPT